MNLTFMFIVDRQVSLTCLPGVACWLGSGRALLLLLGVQDVMTVIGMRYTVMCSNVMSVLSSAVN